MKNLFEESSYIDISSIKHASGRILDNAYKIVDKSIVIIDENFVEVYFIVSKKHPKHLIFVNGKCQSSYLAVSAVAGLSNIFTSKFSFSNVYLCRYILNKKKL